MRQLIRIGGIIALLLVASASLGAQERKPDRNRCIGTNPDAPIVLEVFSDHQCPACRRFYLDVARPLLADYAMKGKVCVIYHEFPLAQHQYAREAARYTVAANEAKLSQEDWIRITDALYFYQPQWSADGKVEPVVEKAIGAEKMAKLRKVIGDAKITATIDHEVELGHDVGVKSTPTVLLTADGRTQQVPPGVQYAILQRYLDNLLAQAK